MENLSGYGLVAHRAINHSPYSSSSQSLHIPNSMTQAELTQEVRWEKFEGAYKESLKMLDETSAALMELDSMIHRFCMQTVSSVTSPSFLLMFMSSQLTHSPPGYFVRRSATNAARREGWATMILTCGPVCAPWQWLKASSGRQSLEDIWTTLRR